MVKTRNLLQQSTIVAALNFVYIIVCFFPLIKKIPIKQGYFNGPNVLEIMRFHCTRFAGYKLYFFNNKDQPSKNQPNSGP